MHRIAHRRDHIAIVARALAASDISGREERTSERGVSARRAGWITVKTLEINEPMNRARHHTRRGRDNWPFAFVFEPGERAKLKFHLPKAQGRGELETNSKWQSDSFTDDNTLRRRVGPAAPVSRFTFWWSLRGPYHTVVCLLLSDPARARACSCARKRARGKLKLNEGPFRAYKEDKRKRYTSEGSVDPGKKAADRYRDRWKLQLRILYFAILPLQPAPPPTLLQDIYIFFRLRNFFKPPNFVAFPKILAERSTDNLRTFDKNYRRLISLHVGRTEVYVWVSVGK